MTSPEPAVAAALARLYDVDLQEDPGDLDLYLAMAARTGGPILELGVGSGRIAVPVAGAGYEVTGVDLDPAMLARARERARAAGPATARNLRLVEGDARTLPDGLGRFKLAVVALNSLLVFGDRRDQRRVLQEMADHLEPRGIALIDVWLPDAEDLGRYDGRLGLEYLRRDPEQGTLVSKLASAVYDAATATVELTAIYDEGRQGEPSRRWLREDRLRLVTADELRSFAEDAGLTIEVIAGGYSLDPIRPGDDRAVLVARRFEGQGAPADIASPPPGRGTRPASEPGGGPALV